MNSDVRDERPSQVPTDGLSLPFNWRREASFKITIKSQVDERLNISKEAIHSFYQRESDWGFGTVTNHPPCSLPSMHPFCVQRGRAESERRRAGSGRVRRRARLQKAMQPLARSGRY